MKTKILILVLSLTIVAISAQAQVRILHVDEQANVITLKNFGNDTEDISDWWFCALFVYAQLNTLTVNSGSLELESNQEVELTGYNLQEAASDLGLYETNTFGDASAMRDFTQWGAGGQGRESVAVTAGIWTAGDFLEIPGPFEYIGDGTQNGLDFWQNVLSTNEFEIDAAIQIYPNPSKGLINISNNSGQNIKKIEIYNSLGGLLFKTNDLLNNQIRIFDLAKGSYFAKVILDDNKSIVKKIIIQ